MRQFTIPSALATNLDGTNVVVPPSHIALRTLAFNDQVVSWFAPRIPKRSCTKRNQLDLLIPTDGEYVPVTLNEGQRDTLYLNKVNPHCPFQVEVW